MSGMGKLLEAFARVRMNEKLKRGRCQNCAAILPDIHPIDDAQACSESCADEIWESRQY